MPSVSDRHYGRYWKASGVFRKRSDIFVKIRYSQMFTEIPQMFQREKIELLHSVNRQFYQNVAVDVLLYIFEACSCTMSPNVVDPQKLVAALRSVESLKNNFSFIKCFIIKHSMNEIL